MMQKLKKLERFESKNFKGRMETIESRHFKGRTNH